MPAPATIRQYDAADASEVAEFFASALAAGAVGEPVSLEDWQRYTAQSFNRAGRDFAVAECDERVVAVLMSYRIDSAAPRRRFRIIVHPEHRRGGIATSMFRWMEERDAGERVVLESQLMGAWKAGERFLVGYGFEETRRSLWMGLDGPGPAPVVPTGFDLRPYRADPADDRAWVALTDEGYRGTPTHCPLMPGDLEVMRAEPRFHLWMAEEAGSIVGLCHTKEWSELGCINSLVVREARRGRGLGRALLVRGIATLRDTDPGRIRLSVFAENTHAVGLYRSVGFETLEELVTWRR